MITFCSPPYSVSASATRRLGLTHAASASQHEHADRFVGIVEVGSRSLNTFSDHFQSVILADDALIKCLGQIQDGGDFVLNHFSDRDPCPIGYNRRHCLLINTGKNEGCLTLQQIQLMLQVGKLCQQRLTLGGRERRRRWTRGFGLHRNFFRHFIGSLFQVTRGAFDLTRRDAELRADIENLFDEFFFLIPARFQSGEPHLLRGQFFLRVTIRAPPC